MTNLIITTKNNLLDMLCKLDCTLRASDVVQILDLMVYDLRIDVLKRDPALQPLIPLGDDLFGICPQLLKTSNAERNMMVYLAHFHNSEYNQTTNQLETLQIEQICKKLAPTKYKVASNKRIPGKGNLPDIDIAIYDPNSKKVLLVELKWTLQAAETSEVGHKEKVAIKGISQVKNLFDFARNTPKEMFKTCFPNTQYNNEIQYIGCVAVRGFVGSVHVWDREIPVIEEELLVQYILQEQNLNNAFQRIQNQEYLPVEGREYKYYETQFDFGKYKFIWNGYSIF